jgi:LacI family transcriptional regulator
VAKYTGLSTATISKYINGGNVLEENKVRIQETIEQLGFKVNELARGLKINKTRTIGVLIPTLENIFSTTIISNVENVLLQNGYSTIICDYKENDKLEIEKLEFLLNKMVDGLIIMPQNISDIALNKLAKNNIPVVLIDRLINGTNCDVVMVDNLNASYNAVEHLITRGHKRIGIISGPDNIYTAQERLKGYIRVHEDYHIEPDQSLIKCGDYQVESGYLKINELLDAPIPPSAVYVTNYEMTLGAIMALNERNTKIPEELSFIGFDNLQLAKIVKPPLSIVIQPMQQIGETAASVLLKRLKGDMSNFPSMFRLKTELLIKDSVCNM